MFLSRLLKKEKIITTTLLSNFFNSHNEYMCERTMKLFYWIHSGYWIMSYKAYDAILKQNLNALYCY